MELQIMSLFLDLPVVISKIDTYIHDILRFSYSLSNKKYLINRNGWIIFKQVIQKLVHPKATES